MSRTSNRGPAAAAGNRRALLQAARKLLAEHGIDVPLSSIAKAAGVSQGVLYRHFPRRVDLAFAVFEENFTELTALAAEEGPDTFGHFVDRLVHLILDSLGFIELLLGARGAAAHYDGDHRLVELVTAPLDRATAAGRVRPELTPDDVELGLRMVYGVAVTAPDPVTRREAVTRVRSILDAHWGLAPR